MRRLAAAIASAALVLLLAGCTTIDGKIYRIQWFKSGTCMVYAKGRHPETGDMYYKAIERGTNVSRKRCYERNKVGRNIRFTVDDKAFREDQ